VDPTHFTFKDVDQLGQFIQLAATQETPHTGNPRISAYRDGNPLQGGVNPHSPEFIDIERLEVFPDSLLFEKDWSFGIQPDQDCRQEEERRDQYPKPERVNSRKRLSIGVVLDLNSEVECP
jgi:hypothetical protein